MGLATWCSRRWIGSRRSWSSSQVTDAERGDLRWRTIPRLVEDAAERFGDGLAVEDGHERITFAELSSRVDVAARALAGSGVAAGDRVAVWAPNGWEWIVAG